MNATTTQPPNHPTTQPLTRLHEPKLESLKKSLLHQAFTGALE